MQFDKWESKSKICYEEDNFSCILQKVNMFDCSVSSLFILTPYIRGETMHHKTHSFDEDCSFKQNLTANDVYFLAISN